jgi:selenocysteine lyase/cysteine desulfurase
MHLHTRHHRIDQPRRDDLRPHDDQGGDEIVVSAMEHHSDIVPWQMLAESKGARLRVIPMNDAGELLLRRVRRILHPAR